MLNHLSHVGRTDAGGHTARRLRDANGLMREALQHADADYKVAFFCECEDPGCYAAVWLTCAEYDQRRGSSRSLVVPGHRTRAIAWEARR